MTFLEIVNAVLAGSFDEAKRPSAKAWVNTRLGELLDMETWVFMRATASVTVTAGSRTVTGLPTAFGVAHSLIDGDGEPLTPFRDPVAFLERYPTNVSSGTPEAWTAIGASIMVGPAATVTSSAFTLIYELAHTDLVADGDVPILPSQYHLMLVHGAKATGMRMLGIPLWNEHEQAFQQSLDAMRRKYLVTVRAPGAAVWS